MHYPLSSGNLCTKFGNYQANSSQNIEQAMLIWRPVVWPWPCDSKSNRDNLLSLNSITEASSATIKQRVKRQTVDNTGKDQQFWPWPLTMWPKISIGVIFSLGASTVPSLATFKQRGKKILSRHRLVWWSTDR